jgi:hypothetical protein
MKKLLSIGLAFSFLLSTMGLSIVIDYCPMKAGYSISFSEKKASCCCSKLNNGCCRSHKVVLKKVEDNYTASEFQATPLPADLIIYDLHTLIVPGDVSEMMALISTRDHQPPEPPVPYPILFRSIQV